LLHAKKARDSQQAEAGTKMSCEVPLANGLEAIVDDQDFELVNQYNWCHKINRNGLTYTVRGERSGEKMHKYMHQLILRPADDYKGHIDHLNGNGLDNRRTNLLLKPHARNLINSKLNKRNKSGLKGVSWNKDARKWSADVTINYKHYFLGNWETPEEAHAAYRVSLAAYYEAEDYEQKICPNKGEEHLSEQDLEILHAFKKADKWRGRGHPQINSTSGYIGVSWHKRDQQWQAYAIIDQKRHFIGYFDDPKTAYTARCAFLEARIGPDQLPKLQRMLKQ
jgi:hypothetical protein